MIALFKSHFSIGKSILTLDDPITQKEGGADSIFSIAVENNLKEIVLVEDSLTGFLQAKKNADKLDIKLVFGLRINMKEDGLIDPKEESLNSSHKVILFARNAKGCQLINKIYSEAFTKNHNCVDHKLLKKHWSSRSLIMAIPFYDSFIYNNLMKFSNCTPNFDFSPPLEQQLTLVGSGTHVEYAFFANLKDLIYLMQLYYLFYKILLQP